MLEYLGVVFLSRGRICYAQDEESIRALLDYETNAGCVESPTVYRIPVLLQESLQEAMDDFFLHRIDRETLERKLEASQEVLARMHPLTDTLVN